MTTTEPTDRIVTLPDGAALQVSDYGGEHTGMPLVLVCGTTDEPTAFGDVGATDWPVSADGRACPTALLTQFPRRVGM
jgi:hypothetical protein